MKRWNGWMVWLLVCFLCLLVVASITCAVIIHNPEHYGARSLLMATLVTLAAEVACTVLGIIAEVID